MNKSIILLFCLITGSLIALAQNITHGPVTGGVTQNKAKVLFFADQSINAQLRYSKQANFSSYDSINASSDPANGNVLKFNLNELESNTRYYHQAYLGGSPASDVGTFKTKPCDGESGNYTFLMGSCQNENRSNDEVFAEMLNHPADFFLQIGDWGYPDDTDNLPNNNDFFPADYSRVIEAYKNKYDYQHMKEFLKTTWMDYVWDDHDYVDDNTSRNTSSYTDFGTNPTLLEIPFPPGTRRNAIKGYYDLFPGFEPVDSSEGTYHKFRYGNIEVFMLDDRAARSPVNDAIQEVNGDYVYAPPPGHSILGDEQRAWLLENLKKSTATWKFITTATAFNLTYRDAIQGVLNLPNLAGLPLASALVDCWSGYPMDQDSIINMVNRENIDGVVMMSGDTHTSGIDNGQAGGLPEIMAGCLSQTNSALVTTVPLLSFGLVWSEGGQGIGNLNTNDGFGKISIDGDNAVTLEVIDENGTVITDYTMYSCSYYSGLDLQVISTEDNKCFGDTSGMVEVAATGGTPPYRYTIDRETYQSSPVFTGLTKGQHTLAVKDSTGCTKEICFSIEQPDSLEININTTPVTCNSNADGISAIDVSGGVGAYTYQWQDSSITTAFDSNLLAGNYQVTVSDSNQCSKQVAFEITEPDALSFNAILEDVSCHGGSDGIATIIPSGGVSPIDILWEDGQNTFTNNQLEYAYNSFTLTDSNSCTYTDSVFIDQADSLYINPEVTPDNGNRSGRIVLNPQGGTPPYLYQWQGPSRSDTLKNIAAGSYSLNLIDANGCLLKTVIEVPMHSSIEDTEFSRFLKIYPNPASTSVQIEWNSDEKAEHAEIFDL
ncbi:MAG: alkaline phosphatase D family protein, partial [Chitinophagales bacterium]